MKFLNKIDGADKVVTDSSNRFVTDAEKNTWNGKVDASQVLTDVPANAVFTDTNTVTSINGKTGAITKADVVALGIPSQDTVYTHPASHPASMIVESITKRFVSDEEKAEWNSKSIKDIGAFDSHEALIMYAVTEQIPTGQYSFFMGSSGHASLVLVREAETYYEGIAQGSDGNFVFFNVTKQGQMRQYGVFDVEDVVASLDDITSIFSQLDDKVDNSRVLTDVPPNAKFTDTVYSHPTTHPASMITGLPTSLPADGGDADTVNGKTVGINVPAGAKFTDTITTINGKTGAIAKADIVALGIPSQDTVYTHPTTHPYSMITGAPTSLPASGGHALSATHLLGDDTRAANSAPSVYMNGGARYASRAGWQTEFKTRTAINSPPLSGTYVYLQTYTPWSDPSGGYPIQVVYGNGTPCWRVGVSTSAWSAWQSVNDNGNASTVNGFTVGTNVPANAKFTDTVYSHPTTAGNKHLPTAGATSNFLIYGGASGTASWSAMSDTLHGTRGGGTQHSVATTSANGFMSGTDKTKLNGIDAGANKITLGTTQPTVGWWFKEIT